MGDRPLVIDGWSPGIGDPTPLGWATTGAYLLAAWLSLRAQATALGKGGIEVSEARRFWVMLAMVTLALAVNKQLDLQSLLTAIGRKMAHDEGWYDARRTAQLAFIVAVALFGGMGLGLTLLHLRRATGWVRLAGVGLTFLVVFVIMRAASFHHMDAMLGREWFGVRINHVLELGGIALIALGAAGDRNRHEQMSTRR